MLKTTQTSNRFCVPAALALLLDTTVDVATNLIRQDLGDQPIIGVYYPLILKHLSKAGFIYQEVKKLEPAGKFLVRFNGHVGVFIDGTYFDNCHPNGYANSKDLLAGKKFKHLGRPTHIFKVESLQDIAKQTLGVTL